MKKLKKYTLVATAFLILVLASTFLIKQINLNSNFEVGQSLDSLNGVVVYYNGGVSHVSDRNVTASGYNLGLKYQCVEFVKRYYYEALDHKMPDSYGNAIDFYDTSLKDGDHNTARNLTQFSNPSISKPQVDDLLIYAGSWTNKYGHVAIISKVTRYSIEIIQQNPGPFGKSRETYDLTFKNGVWHIENERVLGWLHK